MEATLVSRGITYHSLSTLRGIRYQRAFCTANVSHSMELLEVMHSDCPEATKMRVCDDVACEFEPTVRGYVQHYLSRFFFDVVSGHISSLDRLKP
jgi:hypothetical protein